MALTKVYEAWLGKDGLLHIYGTTQTITPTPPNPQGLPTARIVATLHQDLRLVLSGATSSDGTKGATITAYAWTLGDGVSATGPTVDHTYQFPGNYTVALTVTDSFGAKSTTTQQFTVTAPVVTNQKPVVVASASVNGLVTTINATGTTDPDGTIQQIRWGWGDGGADVSNSSDSGGLLYVKQHTYAAPGRYTANVTAVDDKGASTQQFLSINVVSANRAPVPSLVLTQSNMTTTYTAAGSTDPDGDALTYDVDWGDGSPHSAGVTNSHTYGALGPWTVTLAVSDTAGNTATTSKIATPTQPNGGGGGGGGSLDLTPWKNGQFDQDLPNSLAIYRWVDLYHSGDSVMATVNRMPGPGLLNIDGVEVLIESFSAGSGNYGIYRPNFFQGFIGGITGGQLTGAVREKAGAMTQAQANTIAAQQVNQGTTLVGTVRASSGLPFYLLGVDLIGADQPTVHDNAARYAGYQDGPARHSGVMLNNATTVLIQNVRTRGFGHGDDTTPPGEVGQINDAHTTNWRTRRAEIDGKIPNDGSTDSVGWSWRRGGGYQYSQSNSPYMENVYLHDALTSGLTFSFTGAPQANGSASSNNIETHGLILNNQANHIAGQPAGTTFQAINHEFVTGFVHHYNPTIISDPHAFDQWNGAHMRIWNEASSVAGIGGSAVPDITDFLIYEPEWGGQGTKYDNGMFSIRMAYGDKTAQVTPPTVIKNGVSLQAVKMYGATMQTADPATHYLLKMS